MVSELCIPKTAEKEISFMLYNYDNIEKLIDKRKNDLIDTINVSNNAHLKSLNDEGKTIEDIALSFDSDRNIKRLREWKSIINSFKSRLYDDENRLYYRFILLKYTRRFDEESITDILNITKERLKNIDIFLKSVIYSYAVEKNLFKEEVA